MQITTPSKMNDGKIKELLDKFENMEKIPQHFMNELFRAVRESDALKEENVLLTQKNRGLQVAFEKLMERHQELREKLGFDNTTNDLTYELFDDAGLMELNE